MTFLKASVLRYPAGRKIKLDSNITVTYFRIRNVILFVRQASVTCIHSNYYYFFDSRVI